MNDDFIEYERNRNMMLLDNDLREAEAKCDNLRAANEAKHGEVAELSTQIRWLNGKVEMSDKIIEAYVERVEELQRELDRLRKGPKGE